MSNLERNRTVDKDIYSNGNDSSFPKESHKKIISIIQKYLPLPTQVSILDVGCANGSFLLLLSKMLPNHDFQMTGIDLHPNLLEIAKKNINGIHTIISPIEELKSDIGLFDVITCLGTFSVFDDFKLPFTKLYNLMAKKGLLIIFTEFNEFPIDVIVRYKDAQNESAKFESGWNIFSKYSVEKILQDYPDLTYQWVDFKMPFSLKKQADHMRSWTIKTESDNFQQVNGAQQLVNQSILYVTKE